jgi:hypothetical protein
MPIKKKDVQLLKLSIQEQKEIIGGNWKVIIYDPSGKIYTKAYFDSFDEALSWAEEYTKNGGSYRLIGN